MNQPFVVIEAVDDGVVVRFTRAVKVKRPLPVAAPGFDFGSPEGIKKAARAYIEAYKAEGVALPMQEEWQKNAVESDDELEPVEAETPMPQASQAEAPMSEAIEARQAAVFVGRGMKERLLEVIVEAIESNELMGAQTYGVQQLMGYAPPHGMGYPR